MTASPHNGRDQREREIAGNGRDPLAADSGSPASGLSAQFPPELPDAMAAAWAWHLAIDHAPQPDGADWEGFGAWLDAASNHRAAYDAVTTIDAMIGDHRPALALAFAEEDRCAQPSEGRSGLYDGHRALRPAPRRQWTLFRRPGNGPLSKAPPGFARWGVGALAAGGIAAALLAFVNIPSLTGPSSAPAETAYTTAKGETRVISLAKGVSVELAPASRLMVTDDGGEHLQLASGSAFFIVDHRPDRVLSVRAGDFVITDIGTRFTVDRADGAVMVQVSEGQLAVHNGSGKTPGRVARLTAGQQWTGGMATGASQFSAIPVGDIGSWRHGRLVYSDAPLALVAADLARYSGRPVKVAPALGDRRFSGVLTIGDGSKLLETFAGLMGVSLGSDGSAVVIGAGVDS